MTGTSSHNTLGALNYGGPYNHIHTNGTASNYSNSNPVTPSNTYTLTSILNQ